MCMCMRVCICMFPFFIRFFEASKIPNFVRPWIYIYILVTCFSYFQYDSKVNALQPSPVLHVSPPLLYMLFANVKVLEQHSLLHSGEMLSADRFERVAELVAGDTICIIARDIKILLEDVKDIPSCLWLKRSPLNIVQSDGNGISFSSGLAAFHAIHLWHSFIIRWMNASRST